MPETAAGRPIGKAKSALIARMTRSADTVFGPMPDDQFIRALDAIEAEARALGRAEALAAVRTLWEAEGTSNDERYDLGWYDGLGSALAAIDNLETPPQQ